LWNIKAAKLEKVSERDGREIRKPYSFILNKINNSPNLAVASFTWSEGKSAREPWHYKWFKKPTYK